MRERTRVAAIGDLHCTKDSRDALRQTLARVSEGVDVLAICGDLTDYGLPEEAHVLAGELEAVRVPIVAVLGNHDHESGKAAEIGAILTDAGVHLLDGDAVEIQGVGFAGVKGFAGGFGQRALAPWGEAAMKAFVQESVAEALKLESALARLRTRQRVALLHYSPIIQTVQGEPLEIYAFLGSSRLEDPLDRYDVTVVFHGHAHHGSPQGRTKGGVPVYNVSLPLLRRTSGDLPPARIVELGPTLANV